MLGLRSMTKYKTVKIPIELAQQIDEVREQGGYASRAEFIKEAVRAHLDEIKRRFSLP